MASTRDALADRTSSETKVYVKQSVRDTAYLLYQKDRQLYQYGYTLKDAVENEADRVSLGHVI